MGRKITIAQHIAQLIERIEAREWDEARATAAELRERRLNKSQVAQVEELLDQIPEAVYTMSGQLTKYRTGYTLTITATGNKSLSNGDDLAKFLEGKTTKEVCELADRWTPNKDGQPHEERYKRLNPGQQRMNAGNKLRAAWKKGAIMITESGIKAA